MDQTELARSAQRQQRVAKAQPQLVADLGRHVAVEERRPGAGKRVAQVGMEHLGRRLVAGEEAERLDVHHEVGRRALGPQLRRRRCRHRVVARIDLDDRKERRVVAQPRLGRARLRRVEAAAGDQGLVGPGGGADPDRVRHPLRSRGVLARRTHVVCHESVIAHARFSTACPATGSGPERRAFADRVSPWMRKTIPA
jgi:hypothetical protein